MTEKQIQKWEQKRAKGKHSFVFWHGVIGWGVLTATLINLVNYFYPYQPFSLETLVTSYLVFIVGGFFFGVLMWNIQERYYNRAKRNG